MNQQDAEEYTQSLGQIVAGSWRQIALAKRLGVPQALGLTVEQWVNDRLGGYIKLSVTELREAIHELADASEGKLKQKEIAEIIGVHESTVSRKLADARISEPINAIAALAADEKVRAAAQIADM